MRSGNCVGILRKARRREAGTAIVEFAFVILPAMGLLFLLMNLAWILFGWACVQEAVREGVRSAVTCAATGGITAAADKVVVQYSFGFLNTQNVASYATVNFYSPTLVPLKSTDLVTSGTVVKVSVNALPLNTFAEILVHSPMAIQLSATSADVMACSGTANQ
ncbi:MAG: pilus assembly protein [Acidobacteriota bacterium]|nr:pilus assembly protein [Acidobacteriota bacterium]